MHFQPLKEHGLSTDGVEKQLQATIRLNISQNGAMFSLTSLLTISLRGPLLRGSASSSRSVKRNS